MISIDKWQPADGLILEPNALKAAKDESHSLALTAGPGAGKTEMLAQRADFLLRTNTCPYPKRILAISFKVDASKNLKDRVLRRCGTDLGSRFDSYTFHGFAKRIIDKFRPVLKGLDKLAIGYTIGTQRKNPIQITFADLVPLALEILENSIIANNAIRQTYTHVFLDEFQDCTNEQYKLIQKAFGGTDLKLTAVGDTKQKIMGWAGALEGIFNNFAKDFNAIPLQLYRNFRSKPKLLRLQNDIIHIIDPNSVMPENLIQGSEGEVVVEGFSSAQDEAIFIADTINDWIVRDGIHPSEIAVLVSKQIEQYAEHLMQALEKNGISYKNEQQLQDVSSEPLAILTVNFLSCLYNKKSPKAWANLTNLILPFDDENYEVEIRNNINEILKEERRELQKNLDAFDWWSSVRRFEHFLGRNTIVALSPDYENPSRLKEVRADTRKHIEELVISSNSMEKALGIFAGGDSVRILTIHKSKGLEFDAVALMAVENETFFGKIDDERCAFFVGVSRAKRKLVLTSAGFRPKPTIPAKRWESERSVHEEFIGYGVPYV